MPKFKLVDRIHETRNINYGDGYQKTTFKFDRTITKEDFVEYLKSNGFEIHIAEGWWDDHSEITGYGDTWVYTWVLAYTD